jgi:hypothetical protein
MESTTFFPGANRRVTLGSPTKQCSNGRIVFAVQMPLTGESFAGLPDWVGSGFEAVSKAFMEVNPEVQEVSDLALAFSNDAPKGELFAPPSARLPGASLKGFKIVRAGEPDDPEIELHFKAYGPFTRAFWAWIGEMAGNEVYMAFPSTVGGTVTVAKSAPADDDDLDLEPEPEAGKIESLNGDIPEDPTMEEALGEDFEAQVRQSMGAPEPFGDKPRLVDARPGRDKSGVSSKPKGGARKSLAVN